ncbi:unnamed protein product [Cladocopium goreaui]|uniref:Uncharacterized protein n=1 Tax=Cladocopium goreaui TaxID=2562237 RepID=A0A9P1C3N1_9DINO|nr:unnamed protein product [Cladocopium goreaui]
MAGIGITCQSPLKPGHFMVECDPTPNPAPSQSCEGSQHGGGKGSCKPEDKVDEDPMPIFEWIVDKKEHFIPEKGSSCRRSYYDWRMPTEENPLQQPNRLLHEYKAKKMRTYLKEIVKDPRRFKVLIEKRRCSCQSKK